MKQCGSRNGLWRHFCGRPLCAPLWKLAGPGFEWREEDSMKLIATLMMCTVVLASSSKAVFGQTSAAITRWTGCYAVSLGEWSPPILATNAPYHTPPAVIELDSSMMRVRPDSGKLALHPFLT